ncbi:MAG: rhodanese-like domain-containing protein [Rhodospirillales bacterium]
MRRKVGVACSGKMQARASLGGGASRLLGTASKLGFIALALAAIVSLSAVPGLMQEGALGGGNLEGSGTGEPDVLMGTPSTISGAKTSSAVEVGKVAGDCQKHNCAIFDVRPKSDFAKAHLPGALNMDVRFSSARKEYVVANLSALGTDKTKQIIIYGANTSDQAAAALVRQAVAEGFTNVIWMRGGFSEWVKARLPTTAS